MATGSTLLRLKNKMANYRSTQEALLLRFCQCGSCRSGNNLAGGGRVEGSRKRVEVVHRHFKPKHFIGLLIPWYFNSKLACVIQRLNEKMEGEQKRERKSELLGGHW